MVYGSSNPTVYVNVIANYSNLTTAQFFALMQSQNLLLPLNDGVPQTVNDSTGAPIPSSLTGLTSDVYRGLEYSILKNKSSKLFTTTNNITGAVGSATPGLDKMTGFYSDFFEAAAYRNANGGSGLPFLSPGDIAIATAWNLNPNSKTSLPNVSGTVSAAQLPGFILNQNIVNSGNISNATLANGAIDGFGTFTGITEINAGTASNPIYIGTPNVGFIMQLGNDKGFTVTLNGANSYTGGTSILAGDLIIQSDASLGAAPLSNSAFTSLLTFDSNGTPTNVKAAVQAANGIVFNSLTEGNGTLTIGTSTGGTFATSRPIAVAGEAATINVNGNTVTLNGQILSLGTNGTGIGNATGFSDLTIDDLSTPDNGKLILSTASPYFYGNIIIGNTGKPTVEVMSDAAMGNTTGPSYAIGQIVLNGGTFQAGASFSSVRGFSIQSKSTFDTNSFTTTFSGALSDIQRNLTITNTGTGAGAVSFGSFQIGSALELTVSKGTGTSTSVTFTNGIQQNATSDQLLLKPNSGSFGTAETVFTGSASAPTLKNGIVAPWLVIDSGASNNPYDFATYSSANGFTAFSSYATSITAATGTSVVKQSANATLTGNIQAYALDLQKGFNVTVGSAHTLTLGDGTTAGLILNGGSGSGLTGGTLAFGTAAAYISINGSSTISSQITGSGGLNMDGTGTLTLSTASTETGLVTINSGTLSLTTANVFSASTQGVLLQDTKNLATANLTISANNQFAALNSAGNNSTVTISGGAILTIGDSNNLSSTLSSTINDTTVTLGAITKNGTGLLDLSGATITLAAGSSIIANAGQLRVATGALKNTAVVGSAPNFTLANGADLQFAQNGGGQYAGTISGNGTLHLIGGTLQLLGTNNSYTGGTIVETGSTLDITTANLPAANPNITNAGGTVVFDQATTGTYSGVISDGYEMGTGLLLSGTFIKDDSTGANSGNVILTQAQTYTGPTFIEAGTLTLNATDAIASSSGVDLGRVGGGAIASLVLGANNTIQALTNETNNNTSVQIGSYTLTINTNPSIYASYSGSITGTGALIKAGAGGESFSGLVNVGTATINGGLLDLASGGTLTATTATDVNTGVLELDPGSSYTSPTVNVGANGVFYAAGGSTSLGSSTFNNAGILDLNAGTGTNVLTIGTYKGAPGSQLQVGANLGAGTSDQLVVNNASGSTKIVVNDLASNKPGVYNPTGISVVVSATAMDPSTFTLSGGPIQKGLFQYDLAYNPDPAFVLVGVPTADAYRLASVPTATQRIWFDTLGVYLDRQADLRDMQAAGALGRASRSVSSDPYGAPVTPALWARAVGEWANRTQSQNYSIYNNSYTFNTSYTQDTGAFYGGVDGGRGGVLSADDTLLIGVTGGYVYSKQAFQGSTTIASYQGGSFGVNATYINHNFFIDAVLKADFLGLTYSAPALASVGNSLSTSGVQNYGGILDGGYRFTIFGKSFVEPLASLGYMSTHVGGLSLGGTQVAFGNNDNLRGRLGLRGGTMLFETEDYRVEGSATASYWQRLTGGAAATLNSGVGAPLLTIADTQVTSYGEIGLGLNLFSNKTGWSGFVKTDFQLSSDYNAGSVKGGVRYDF